MTDHTTSAGATVARATRIHAGRCAQCHGAIIGGRERRYCIPDCREQARVDRARTRDRSPEWIARRQVCQRAYRRSVAGLRSHYRGKRKGRLDGTEGYRTRENYLAAMARTNRRRRKKNQAWAHEHQTKYAGPGLRPLCVTCGEPVVWSGRGRPRDRCPIHDTARRR